MECGEIASSLAVHAVRESLLHEPPFGPGGSRKAVTPNPPPGAAAPGGTQVQLPSVKPLPVATEMQIPALKPDTTKAQPAIVDPSTTEVFPPAKGQRPAIDEPNQGGKWLQQRLLDRESESRDSSSHQRRLMQAIREANQKVFSAARSGFGQQGMGATMEVVVIDVNQAVIGHVGDSRVYHLRDGKMSLITHDQTYVFREVAEGRMTPEQAETHPRRSELQQAVGGRVDIFPDFYTQELLAGDWLVICSDGLPNAVKQAHIEAIVTKSSSASQAARRLVNRANQMNAMDNVSVIVVHVI
jgi:serine/threonine protein phosphatase PrpC